MGVAKIRRRVRIPPDLAHLFPGETRKSEYFFDEGSADEFERKWAKEFDELRKGAERSEMGLRSKTRTLSVEDACEGWLETLAQQRRARTIQSYRWTLVPVYRLDGATLLSRYDLAHWDAYARTRRADEASDDALLRERQAVQAAAKWAKKRGFAVHEQVWEIPRPKPLPVKQRRFDPAAVDIALEKLEGQQRAIAELAVGTGMRLAELRAARVEWINWDSLSVKIPHTKAFSPKGAKARELPVSPRLEKILKDWLDGRESGLLFPPQKGHRVGKGFAAWRVTKALRDVGLIIGGLHDLRHHYLSQLASRGLDIRTVQELAGHKYSKTTDLYMHASPDYLDRARKAIDLGPGLGPKPRRKKLIGKTKDPRK